MAVKDLEKERAIFAYQCVEKANSDKGLKDDYKSYVKKIPTMILTNGLGATFAFIYSKNGNAYELIYTQTNEWLKKDDKKNLIDWIINLESSEHRAVTNEILALFGWLKRFADGMIEKDS